MICPACSSDLAPDFATPRLTVLRCRSCGHRIARHAAAGAPEADYHQQYDQGAFLESLQATRVRQAHRIVGFIREVEPGATSLLDYGSGRGWFLEEARAAGFRVTGADSSPMAVRLLRERGIDAVDLDQPIAAEVVTLLDVIEHFRPDELAPRLAAIRAKLIVIKVPTSDGLLYRLARGRVREQLYQVGTSPPHFHYFNGRSLRLLAKRASLDVVAMHRDRDFEPRTLAARAGVGLPLAGYVAAALVRVLRMEDSIICVARAS